MRNERSFNQMLNVIATKAKTLNDAILSRKKKAPNYSILQYLEDQPGKEESYHPEAVQDHYGEVYYEALNTLTASIQQKLKQTSFKAYEHIKSALLTSIAGQEINK